MFTNLKIPVFIIIFGNKVLTLTDVCHLVRKYGCDHLADGDLVWYQLAYKDLL